MMRSKDVALAIRGFHLIPDSALPRGVLPHCSANRPGEFDSEAGLARRLPDAVRTLGARR